MSSLQDREKKTARLTGSVSSDSIVSNKMQYRELEHKLNGIYEEGEQNLCNSKLNLFWIDIPLDSIRKLDLLLTFATKWKFDTK